MAHIPMPCQEWAMQDRGSRFEYVGTILANRTGEGGQGDICKMRLVDGGGPTNNTPKLRKKPQVAIRTDSFFLKVILSEKAQPRT